MTFPYDPVMSCTDEITDPPEHCQPCINCGQPVNLDIAPWIGGWDCNQNGDVWHLECPTDPIIETDIPFWEEDEE